MSKKYLSINIKATSTSWAVINDEFEIEKRDYKKVDHINNNSEKMILEVKELVDKLQNELGKLDGVVIILPGGIDSTNNTLTSKSRWLSLPEHTNLKEVFGEHINKKFYFINDANASVLGAKVTGEAEAHNSIVYLICRTGIGSGVMIDGKLMKGKNSMLGEIGKIEMKGTTIETNLSYKTLLSKTILISGKEISTINEIIELSKVDERINELLINWKEAMIKTLASIIYIYDPDLIRIESTMLDYDYFNDWDIEANVRNIIREREISKIEKVPSSSETNIIPLLGAVWAYLNN